MKGYKILYFAVVETPAPPDAGYYKLYPKADGWFALDSDGNEVPLGAHIILDGIGGILPQRAKLQFSDHFLVTDGGPEDADTEGDDVTYVSMNLGGDSEWPLHGNEGHTSDFLTLDDLIDYFENLDFDWMHEQDTDLYLDRFGDNEVSAAALRALLDANMSVAPRIPVRTTQPEYSVSPLEQALVGNAENNHVKFILPQNAEGLMYTFRHGGGTYAVNIERSGMDMINVDGVLWEGITLTEPGSWVMIIYNEDDAMWYVTADSGLNADNDIG